MQWERPTQLFARKALTSEGWRQDVLLTIGADGMITSVQPNAKAPTGMRVFDLLLCGMSNVHSHAFQRAMAGLAEKASGAGQDHFWSWREAMYGFVQQVTPEQMQRIARALYIDLLKQGYTAVGEFHYVHHDVNGKPYANVTEMSDRVIAAAQESGIHLTHLPVMYETGNFGGAPVNERQKRFTHTADGYVKLVEALSKKYAKTEGVTLGVAPHSLRAVPAESLKAMVGMLPAGPIHMHVAEQEKEVADCLAATGKRPVEWLLDNHKVDARWCLVHATHMTETETKRLAASGAIVGVCPTTEANLGDGIFSGVAYLKAGGAFGIGSDSNVCLSPWEELRILEYSQRLLHKKRTLLAQENASVGRTLFANATSGGAQALGLKAGQITAGYRADLMALSMDDALLAERKDDAILDTLIFAVTPQVTDVWVAGKWVVKDAIHVASGT